MNDADLRGPPRARERCGEVWVESQWDGDRSYYERLLTLPPSGWAWEFARRNPELAAKATAARRRLAVVVTPRRRGTVTRVKRRCHEAEKFGLHCFPDPSETALKMIPFWLPEVASERLDATAETNFEERRDAPLSLAALPGARHYLLVPGRRPKLMIVATGYAVQLAIDEGAGPLPQALFVSVKLGAGALAGDRLGPVQDFAAFCAGAGVTSKPRRGLHPEKLRDALIAIDGAGASRRRIAAAVYGEKRAAEDWDNGDETLKKRVKRLVEKGEKLIYGGYLDLL